MCKSFEVNVHCLDLDVISYSEFINILRHTHTHKIVKGKWRYRLLISIGNRPSGRTFKSQRKITNKQGAGTSMEPFFRSHRERKCAYWPQSQLKIIIPKVMSGIITLFVRVAYSPFPFSPSPPPSVSPRGRKRRESWPLRRWKMESNPDWRLNGSTSVNFTSGISCYLNVFLPSVYRRFVWSFPSLQVYFGIFRSVSRRAYV